jgi:hypothetical protein
MTMETGGVLHRSWGKLKIGSARSSSGRMVASRGMVERAHTWWMAWWRKRGGEGACRRWVHQAATLTECVRGEEKKKRTRHHGVLIALEWGGARSGPGEHGTMWRWNWRSVPAARDRVCRVTWGVAPRFEWNSNFELYSNWFGKKRPKRCLPLHKIFQIKYGHVDNWIRIKFPHWSFSKLGIQFENLIEFEF